MPSLGASTFSEARGWPLRRYCYTLTYRAESDEICVLAVAHQSLSPEYWIERLVLHLAGNRWQQFDLSAAPTLVIFEIVAAIDVRRIVHDGIKSLTTISTTPPSGVIEFPTPLMICMRIESVVSQCTQEES